jgi:hypothetical protein
VRCTPQLLQNFADGRLDALHAEQTPTGAGAEVVVGAWASVIGLPQPLQNLADGTLGVLQEGQAAGAGIDLPQPPQNFTLSLSSLPH